MPEWIVSILIMERALDAVVRRAKRVDRKHDIPYLAGYSKLAIAPAQGECICGKRSACDGSPYRADYRRGYRADMLANEILSRELQHCKAVARYAGLTGSPDENGGEVLKSVLPDRVSRGTGTHLTEARREQLGRLLRSEVAETRTHTASAPQRRMLPPPGAKTK
jgi:hypothetical protein